MLFTLRMYYVFEFVLFGINSMARQKGDALGWVEMLFSLAADAIALPWLGGLLIAGVVNGMRGVRKG